MTIAATRTLELNIDAIVKNAAKLAGLMGPGQSTSDPAYAPVRATAMDFLETICKDIQTEAPIERHVTEYTGVVSASDESVPIDDAEEVIAPMSTLAYLLEAGATQSSPVALVSRFVYQAIPDKTTIGTPTLGYFDRLAGTMTLWPVPINNATLSLTVHRLCADVSNASNTLDFERHWESFFIWELAHHLSVSSGIDLPRCAYLRSEAVKKKESAKRLSLSTLPQQVKMSHSTPWSR